jgi:Mg-chelatase subunit ChlD
VHYKPSECAKQRKENGEMVDQNNSLAVRGGTLAKQLSKSLKVGSLDDLVRVQKESNIWLLLDTSGSMSSGMRNGRQRIAGLRETVEQIQTERRMQMIAFNDHTSVVESIPDPSGGTPLDVAINLARTNECSRCIVIRGSTWCSSAILAIMVRSS